MKGTGKRRRPRLKATADDPSCLTVSRISSWLKNGDLATLRGGTPVDAAGACVVGVTHHTPAVLAPGGLLNLPALALLFFV